MTPSDPQDPLPPGLKNLATSLNNLNLQTLRRKSLHPRPQDLPTQHTSTDDSQSPVKTEPPNDPDPSHPSTTTPLKHPHDPHTPAIAPQASSLANPIISTPGVSAPPSAARRVPSDDPHTLSRDAALRRELEQVRQANLALSVVLSAVRISQTNLDGVLSAANNADRLLDSWVAVLSQTQHTYALLSDANYWSGLHDDLARHQAEKAAKAAALAAAQQELREQQRRKEEEDAKKQQEEAARAEAARIQQEQNEKRNPPRIRPQQRNNPTARSFNTRRRTTVAPVAADDSRRRGTMVSTPSSATRRPPPASSRGHPGSSIPTHARRTNPK